MSNDDEELGYSDEEIDEKKHKNLLDKILNLNKAQQLKKPSRTEPAIKISEFDLVKSLTGKKGSIQVDELTKVLEKKKTHVDVKKKVEKASKNSRTLPKPLEKPLAERISRAVAYEKSRLDLDRWEPIVTSNRVSSNLVFPIPTKDIKREEMTSKWRLKTNFDIEMEKINPPKVEEIHVDIDANKFPSNMNEIMEHRKESAKFRALQSYKESKARRQRKIKSKKFHRIQKKLKIKQQLKEFEILQKTDPEEALKKLDEIEKIRAQERFSLRHKSTGKWAQNKQIRAKYDKESRQELAEQLKISKELTEKVNKGNDSDDDDEDDNVTSVNGEMKMNLSEKDNPWLNSFKADDGIINFVENYKKVWLGKDENTEKKINDDEESVDQNMTEINPVNETENSNTAITSNGPISLENLTEVSERKRKQHRANGEIVSDTEVNEEKTKKHQTSKKKKDNSKDIKSKENNNKKKTKKKLNKSLSTSQWEVTLENENIDAVFDKIEKKLNTKIQKKIAKIQNSLEPKKKKKKNKKSIGNDEEKESLLALPIQKKRPNIDEPLLENTNDKVTENDSDLNNLKNILEHKGANKKKKQNNNDIDPNQFTKSKEVIKLDSEIPDLSTHLNEDDEMDGSKQRDLMSEAFCDDEMSQDFAKEKANEIKKDQPKDIDLSLPGWGTWAGAGIVPSKRKRKRFIIKVPKVIPRRDDNKGFLIINEDSSKVKEHMVDEIPYPFNRVEDFEASIRAPVGRNFVPETAFRKNIRPAVRTRIGTIIEPMTKDVLLNKPSSVES